MATDAEVFERYKSDLIYKTIANHLEKYFLDATLLPEEALHLFSEKINMANSFKKSLPYLKEILNDLGVLKYREQFRQYKYRTKNELHSIKVKKETYDKIKALSVDFDGIDDLLFEYAFDKRYHIDTAVIDNLPTGLTEEEQLKVLLHRVNHRVKSLITMSNQIAFEHGFKSGQNTKKIRSKKGMDLALKDLNYEFYRLIND